MKKIIFIVLLLPFGVFAQTEIKIKQDSLPITVNNELHKQYATYAVTSILKLSDKQQNVTYKIEVQKKNTVIDLLYDNQGKLISKVKSKIYSYDGTEKPKSTPANSNDGHNHQH